MRTLRVAMAQVNPTVGDLRGNAELILHWFAQARAAGADVVAFPELCITGYPPEDLLLKRSFVRENLDQRNRVVRAARGPVAVFGFVDDPGDGRIYNAAAVAAGGRLRGVYHKVELPNYGVFDEKRYFAPGSAFPLFVVRGVQVGVTVCEDGWVDGGPVSRVASEGAEVVLNINASPYHVGKSGEREALFRRRATESRIAFFYVQTVGGQDELIFDGASLAYDASGNVLATASQFREDLVVVDLDLPDRPRRRRASARVVEISGPPRRHPRRPPLPARRPSRPVGRAEEVYGALVLGTKDYVRKNGFTGAVIGLSGGIDSSLTAAVAADSIGAQNVVGISMPSEVTSDESIEDAKELASNLGLDFRIIPIARTLRAYLDTLEETFEGRPADVTEENLQSRIRGTVLMAYSNKFGHIVLTTGNKSEMATGYATLYGDMAGGFAVLKDVPKTLVYELCRWRNEQGNVIPARVLTKPPSAELRLGQLDTDSLPPYEVLDPILELYVEQDASIRDIVAAGYDEAVVRRIVEMVDRSEYKRRQAPPGVKITHRAFGKDRRLPITNRFRQPGIPVPARVTGKGKR